MASPRVQGLDRIVLVCRDVERSLGWYLEELGLAPVRIEEWRSGTAPFPSVRIDEGSIIDLVPGPPTGRNLDHFCLVVQPDDIAAVVASGRFTIVDGPAPRFGARGVATSVYVTDPDDNVVELRAYPA